MSVIGSGQAHYIRNVFFAAMLSVTALVLAPPGAPTAAAEGCPDVEVIFARGTFEPPGVGGIGQAFVDQLKAQPQLGGKSVDVYAVNYPASLNFSTAADGVIDASNRVRDMAARCPDAKIVLGGYSQGAAVAGYVTADKIPDGYVPPNGINGPMPPEIAKHVAAVALFGKPSNGFLNSIDRSAPPITVGASLCSQDHRPVRARRPDLLTDGQRQRRAHGLRGQRDDRSGGRIRRAEGRHGRRRRVQRVPSAS